MFKAGSALIAGLPKAIGVAEADNTQKGSIYRVAAVETTGKGEVEHPHHGRGRFGAALASAKARGTRGVKEKPVLVAKNETRVVQRAERRRPEEAKAHGVRKAARARGEGDHDVRRRSHVV
jgi:hypothetical protein